MDPLGVSGGVWWNGEAGPREGSPGRPSIIGLHCLPSESSGKTQLLQEPEGLQWTLDPAPLASLCGLSQAFPLSLCFLQKMGHHWLPPTPRTGELDQE